MPIMVLTAAKQNFLADSLTMSYNRGLPRNGISSKGYRSSASILTTEERNEQTSVQNKSLILAQDERWRRA